MRIDNSLRRGLNQATGHTSQGTTPADTYTSESGGSTRAPQTISAPSPLLERLFSPPSRHPAPTECPALPPGVGETATTPQLTRTSLEHWTQVPGISQNEKAQREIVTERILAGARKSNGSLVVKDALDLSDCTSLTQLPPGLRVRRDLYLSACTSLTQ